MNIKIIFFILLVVGVLSSCETNEGVGGNATIKGRLVLEQYNDDFSLLVNSFAAADENVYIQYGDADGISDDVETSYDGYFEFPYLYEGDYTVFYYSEDSANLLASVKEVLIQVSLSKGQAKDLGELKSLESLEFDEGYATIKGLVYEVDQTSYYKDTLMATDLAVYLRYGDEGQYDERIRSQEDGSFYFEKLIPGDYTIYAFSEDTLGSDQQIAIEKTITVESNDDQVYDIGTLFIHNM